MDANYYPGTIDPALLQAGPASGLLSQNDAVARHLPFEQQQQLGWGEQDEQNLLAQLEWDGLNSLAQPSGSDPGPSAHLARRKPLGRLEDHKSSHGVNLANQPTNQEDEHSIISQSPFKCHCGKEFTRLSSLQRHIRGAQKHLIPEYPCHECTTYQGKNGFKRKDHLVQHLSHSHNYDDNQLGELFPTSETRMHTIPVCHFEDCEYYRSPEFKKLGIKYQQDNRPFGKQSDYTTHMKHEHDWSPYPCKVPGCSKLDGNGFFNTIAFQKHYKEKHPQSTIPISQDGVAETVECNYCHKILKPGSLVAHHSMNEYSPMNEYGPMNEYSPMNEVAAKGSVHVTVPTV
ncbi:hypothetical protein F5Y12DRAFT_717890 [Xylaria sp. FL1777]|nr:hypothetical protein F5Y12DRAFT_717890 [Xylaria sp. FL1777]